MRKEAWPQIAGTLRAVSPHEVPWASHEPPQRLWPWVLTVTALPSLFPSLAFLLCARNKWERQTPGGSQSVTSMISTAWLLRFLFSLVSGTSSAGEDVSPLRLWPLQSVVYLLGCDAALFTSWRHLGWRRSSVLSCSVEWWAHSHGHTHWLKPLLTALTCPHPATPQVGKAF